MKKNKFLLFRNAISLLLCISMLMGTTFAWFTDVVTSKTNRIVVGSLDVEFEYLNSHGNWDRVSEYTNVFKENALWEPGYTEVIYLRVRNAGNLALKYSLGVKVASEKGSFNVHGERFLLSDYIHFGVIESDEQISPFGDRSKARQALDKTSAIKDGYTANGSLAPADQATDKQRSETYIALVVYMPENVGNEANCISGADAPEINLGLSLVATQGSFEEDSFGGGYDAEADLPEFNFPATSFNESVSESAQVDGEGRLTQAVHLNGDRADATVPSGVTLINGLDRLTLNVKENLQSEADLTIESNESIRSLDVHIDGISEHNTVPITVTLKAAVPTGLNDGNLSIYHVENNTTVKMVPVDQNTVFSAHNQFKYDPASGDLVLYIASFSEIAFVADKENAWNGAVDTEWYDDAEAELYISNADQLAGLGALVSGGNSFSGKTVTLLNDVNMGGKDTRDGEGKLIFYPIGYNEDGYQAAFSGIFDGLGHTVSNIFQSTWMLRGNYGNGYYNEAMGLFGYVYEGTIRNLTVSGFVSEGEFAPTGCVATYSANSTFENISIKNCHPQTYNTSVSAVVGRDGKNGCSLTFRNITVDSSNKISALWGSWDVGAAGLLGYLGSDSKVTLDNCHVAATIDVYNDVCGNYQYYWYRYCGMLIGTVDKTNSDGSLDLSNITATGCTVNFGDRHEYFYCEDVDNTIASYTHDYQFSRIPHSELSFTDANGNGMVDTNEVSSVIGCKHDHAAAGSEMIDGKEVLKEDKQAVYIPFYQLFGGYGWGVDGIDLAEYNDLQISVDRKINTGLEESVDKFLPQNGITRLESGKTYKLGDLFSAIDGVSINGASVTIGITDKNTENTDTVRIKLELDADDWTQSTVVFTGNETVDIIIQDYSFCNPTVLYNVQIVEPNILINTEEFLYGSYFDHDRVGHNNRILTGDYGKIRSADKLLPAQDITIKVTNTDTTNYKVTLGYFDSNGNYTGRNGIIPMVDGELSFKASEIGGAYFRVNVYIYNGKFTKVSESAVITVYGAEGAIPDVPANPDVPTDPDIPEKPDPEKPWSGKKITVIGDSISTGGYVGTLGNMTGASIQNLSVSGTKLVGGISGKVQSIDADSDLIIIFGGTNDYWHKNTAIGDPDSPNTFVGALDHILNYLKANHPDAEYLFVFPPDQTFGGNPSSTDFGYGTLDDFRAAFLDFCNENNVQYVNLAETEFDPSKHSGDGVHPNSAGHQIIAEAIYEKISTGAITTVVKRNARLLPTAVSDLPEGALASAPGVVFNTAPYAYIDTNRFAGKHITRIGIPVKSVKALDENQTFTLSVVKTASNAYEYVSQYTLTLPLNQLGEFTAVNKWIYIDVDITLGQDETLAFGMPTDTVEWAYSKANDEKYNFRSSTGSWSNIIKESIIFDVYATETLEFKNTEHGYASVTTKQVFPDVLSDFPASSIAAGNDVEFTNPPYSYLNQNLFSNSRITKIGIPVKRVQDLDENQTFTLSIIKRAAEAINTSSISP